MALTDLMVIQEGHDYHVEGTLVRALDGRQTVLALVHRTALEDHFRAPGGLTFEQRNLLVDRNLPAFERVIAAKYERGERSVLPRFGRDIPLVEITLADIERSGEALSDSVLAMARAARWHPA